MTIVIDASVALKWVLPEDNSDLAEALRAENLIAPPLWLMESANALWRNVRIGKISASDAARLLNELSAAPIAVSHKEGDVTEAFDLAVRLAHPIYDCLYIALAQREKTYVVTADRRLADLANNFPDIAPSVRLLGSPRS
jgi:predicted nucleic acid-binding protein